VVWLTLVSVTLDKVRTTAENTRENDEKLWPDPTLLWPEYLVTSVAAISFITSLRTSLQIS
jgi:hypothetical protein